MLETKAKKFAIPASAVVIAVFILLLMAACDRNQPSLTAPAAQSNISVAEEKFCNADVCGGEILIKFDGCPSDDRMAALTTGLQKLFRAETKDYDGQVSQVGSGCLFLAHSAKFTVRELLQVIQTNLANKALLASYEVEDLTFVYAEPNFKIVFDSEDSSPLPDDERFLNNEQWGLGSLNVHGADADVVRAWLFSRGSKDVVVGVLDTGLATEHEDLKDNLWHAPKDFAVFINGENIPCLPGSFGYNALGTSKESKCLPEDENGHGTQVTGVIGAKGNNKIGIAGVNWDVTLLGLRIGVNGTCVSNAIKGIDFAIQAKRKYPKEANIRVLNASWGYISTPECEDSMKSLKDKIAEAGKNDILFVASAGNGGNDNDTNKHYPSGFDLENVISVTAFGKNGELFHSNHGKNTVHLAAPGEKILSTFPPPRNYDTGGFTSMAAPFVSGAAALILSTPGCKNLHPPDLKRLIMQGAVATRALSNTATGGRLSVYNSIKACSKMR